MALLVAVVAAALAIPMLAVVASDQRAAFVSDLEVDTLSASSSLSAQPVLDWQETAADVADRTGARVVIVNPDRSLIADSDNSGLDRLFDRPEINDALAGSLTSDVRRSETLGEDLRYVAAPIVQDYGIVGAVRLSLPESAVDEQIRITGQWLLLFVTSVVVAAGLVAWFLARSIVSPLRSLGKVAAALPENLELRADEDSGPPEVRSVARALNITARRLSGMLQRTRLVAAESSHHLRTPLTGVRLRLEGIEDTSDDPRVQDDARAAIAEVDRLNRRIEQVLALARTDAGTAPLETQNASVIVEDRIDAADGMFGEREVALESSIARGITVMAPAGTTSRIIDELLGNALQYARTTVEVSLSASDGMAVLTVGDDGAGLPEDERERIFQRFARGTQSAPGGSGLGLALVRESVVALGGSATAEQSRLGGLDVTVTIPLARP